MWLGGIFNSGLMINEIEHDILFLVPYEIAYFFRVRMSRNCEDTKCVATNLSGTDHATSHRMKPSVQNNVFSTVSPVSFLWRHKKWPMWNEINGICDLSSFLRSNDFLRLRVGWSTADYNNDYTHTLFTFNKNGNSGEVMFTHIIHYCRLIMEKKLFNDASNVTYKKYYTDYLCTRMWHFVCNTNYYAIICMYTFFFFFFLLHLYGVTNLFKNTIGIPNIMHNKLALNKK